MSEEIIRIGSRSYSKTFDEYWNRIMKLEQENQQLKECYCNRTDCIGRIKDSKKYDSVKQQLDKSNSILTELEEWLKSHLDDEYYWSKIYWYLENLKEKYK